MDTAHHLDKGYGELYLLAQHYSMNTRSVFFTPVPKYTWPNCGVSGMVYATDPGHARLEMTTTPPPRWLLMLHDCEGTSSAMPSKKSKARFGES